MPAPVTQDDAKPEPRPWPFPAHRLVFALAIGITLLLALDVAAFYGPALAADLPLLFGADLIVFGLAHVLLLSSRLAGIAAAVALLVFVWAAGVLAMFSVAMTPSVFAALLAMDAVGVVLILQQLYAGVGDICRGRDPATATQAAAQRMVAPAICASLAMLAGVVSLGAGEELLSVIGAGAAAAVSLGVAIFAFATAFAGRIGLDEQHISRANRARELAEDLVAKFAVVARPRWAFACLGITAIVFAILLFADRSASLLSSPLLMLWYSAGAPLGFAFLVTAFIAGWMMRDWRTVPIAVLPAYLAATGAVLLAGVLGLGPADARPAMLVLGASFGSGLGLVIASRFAAHSRFDGAPDIAVQRSLNDCAMPIAAATAALALGNALLAATHGAASAIAVVLIAETILSLILVAIFATVVTELFPRRRSFDEMYGGKPRVQADKQ